jgi:hypothetical protein
MFGFGVGRPDQADLPKDEATTPSEMPLAYGPDRYERLARIKRRRPESLR